MGKLGILCLTTFTLFFSDMLLSLKKLYLHYVILAIFFEEIEAKCNMLAHFHTYILNSLLYICTINNRNFFMFLIKIFRIQIYYKYTNKWHNIYIYIDELSHLSFLLIENGGDLSSLIQPLNFNLQMRETCQKTIWSLTILLNYIYFITH